MNIMLNIKCLQAGDAATECRVNGGFSVVEVMVAMMIMSFAILAAATMLTISNLSDRKRSAQDGGNGGAEYRRKLHGEEPCPDATDRESSDIRGVKYHHVQ